MKISAENVRTLLDYDPETGKFIWRQRAIRPQKYFRRTDAGWNTRFAGKAVADRVHRHGHLQIGLFCKTYMAHIIAWMHYYGENPTEHIDHIDGNPANNRIRNLRLANQTQNMMNSKLRRDNTSGVKGVYWRNKEKKWAAQLTINKKVTPLGFFDHFEEAVVVRKVMEQIHYRGFAGTPI